MLEGKEVTWLPSYGPEMRGGTANCSAIGSDEPVASPIVDHPNILLVMNLPSLDKYEDAVLPAAWIFVDSTLIERTDAGGRTCATFMCLPHGWPLKTKWKGWPT